MRKGEGGASGPTGPTGVPPLLTKHELHPAWTAHRSPCGSGMNSCMGSVDVLANGCSARPSPARAGRFMGARRGAGAGARFLPREPGPQGEPDSYFEGIGLGAA